MNRVIFCLCGQILQIKFKKIERKLMFSDIKYYRYLNFMINRNKIIKQEIKLFYDYNNNHYCYSCVFPIIDYFRAGKIVGKIISNK